jgi:hypothetical protein
MKRRANVWTVVGSVAVAMGLGLQTAPVQASDGPVVVRRLADPVTGSEVRVYRGSGRDAAIEVADSVVTVRKAVAGASVRTTIKTNKEHWTVAFDASGLSIETPAGAVLASSGHPDAFESARRELSRSAAVQSALRLLARVNLGPRSPEGHLLMTTRAMLLGLGRNPSGRLELTHWLQTLRQPTMVRVGLDMTPSECWEAYAKEAIAAATDYEDCLRSKKWYDLLGQDLCEVVYDLRAMAAFSWWVRCVTFM